MPRPIKNEAGNREEFTTQEEYELHFSLDTIEEVDTMIIPIKNQLVVVGHLDVFGVLIVEGSVSVL